MTRILCLSNGHGEDLNASQILHALRTTAPQIEVAAMPLVGLGNSYRSLDIPIIGPTRNLPSGGFFYMDNRKLVEDLRSGLVGLTLGQLKTILTQGRQFDLVLAVGDILPHLFAFFTGLPYVSFIVSSSGHYGHIDIHPLLRSPRCLQIFTRDAYSVEYLSKHGIDNAMFAGNPFMDTLCPTGQELFLQPTVPTIALLPGSRPPEATRNFSLLLDLCTKTAQVFGTQPVQFRAALVPSMMPMLPAIADQAGWHYLGHGKLQNPQTQTMVLCFDRAFADILNVCDLVVGMAGTAIEQAVGLGKPVIQIIGDGPQFTYRFADAQMRLLGDSVKTVGTVPATPDILQDAAQAIKDTLANTDYLEHCRRQGAERVGKSGGSLIIAQKLVGILEKMNKVSATS